MKSKFRYYFGLLPVLSQHPSINPVYTTSRNNELPDSDFYDDFDNDANPDTSVEMSSVGMSKTQCVDDPINFVGDLPETDNTTKKRKPEKVKEKQRRKLAKNRYNDMRAGFAKKKKKWRNDCDYWWC